MTLIKWTPRPASIFDGMDKMISNVFDNDWNFPVTSNMNWSPSIDVKESIDYAKSKSNKDDLIFIGGRLFLMSQINEK